MAVAIWVLVALTVIAAAVIGYWLVRSKALRFDRDATEEGL